ncbi:MAG TPA: glutaminyl-peptide cyclotransferase [Bacteroides sp.]|nr:glutaminyl-peptide cyclotransferase [Bacteroides sp.]
MLQEKRKKVYSEVAEMYFKKTEYKHSGLLRVFYRRGNLFPEINTTFKLSLIIIIFLSSCGKNLQPKSSSAHKEAGSKPVRITGTKVESPASNQKFKLGDNIPIRIERITDTLPAIDSMEFYLDGSRIHTAYQDPYEYMYSSKDLSMGTKPVRIVSYYADGRKEFHNTDVIILSDIVPQYIHYRILNTWPHDVGAYTQGLVYEDGYLYEGTGQYAGSSLRKMVISSGEPERVLNLPDDVFGEGIAILNDKIYQLTYKSQVGFVYEKENFKRIQKVYYENKEGWGLTHDGVNLIMSDGSHRIYFMDPEYFTELKQIEIYDNMNPVTRLNELEYIEGKIFANIYGEEEIVIIDPLSGRVTGKLNMKGILPQEERQRRIDVFNGIAWNPEKRVLYVTGKYWPKLFEISLQGEF